MGQLDLCSRKEADRLIESSSVLVRGIPAVLGQKVLPSETDIKILENSDEVGLPAAVVLHKPLHYVSGQPEHGHVPAVKLLTRDNGIGEDIEELFALNRAGNTLIDFAPAGRLDRESTGLLIFSRSGVVAKRLVSSSGIIEKEYRVNLEHANQVTANEKKLGLKRLPPSTLDLDILKYGGARLLGDERPLRSVKARWVVPGRELQLILKEGRKHQIRRMCRELLGYHVKDLKRTRIGPVHIHNVPLGKWRPLTPKEIELILTTKRKK